VVGKDMAQIFVSYKRGTDGVESIVKELEKVGYSVWFDRKDINLGDSDWRDEIDNGLAQCEGIIFCVTSEACKSENVRYEIRKAISLNKVVFPIALNVVENIEDCLSEVGLPTRQHIESFNSIDKWDTNFEKLLAGLESHKIISATKESKNLRRFKELLENPNWSKEIIDNKEMWIAKEDSLYQIEIDSEATSFTESWSTVFPDKLGSEKYYVNLRVQGVIIRQLHFVYCDGGRVQVPLPKRKMLDGKLVYYWEENSIEFMVAQLIGEFYIYGSLYDIARLTKVEVI